MKTKNHEREKVILGVDPGSIKAGFGVLQVKGPKVKYLYSTTCYFAKDVPHLNRMEEIFLTTQKIIEKFNPHEIALESLIFVKNPNSLMKLAQARGAMLAAISETYREKVFEYSPNEVKQATIGHGHADKYVLQNWLNKLFGPIKFKSDDESDALCIAFCHALSLNSLRTKIPKQKKTGSLSDALNHRLRD
jgi:crossover junction endodeoxyribonuclease RuvC